jgi:predicted helicase
MVLAYERDRKKGAALTRNPEVISWSLRLEKAIKDGRKISFDSDGTRVALYRPFTKHVVYFNNDLNEQTNRLPRYLPTEKTDNQIIVCPGVSDAFSPLITDLVPDLCVQGAGHGVTVFPRYHYTLLADSILESGSAVVVDGYVRHDAISDKTLALFRSHYADQAITKDAIFAYVYALLHDYDYRRIYASNLKKQRPRIPLAGTFDAFADVGRELINLHLSYETAEHFALTETWQGAQPDVAALRVEKMRYGRLADKSVDKTVIVYNSYLTLSGIPQRAQKYVINGRSALDWVVERYRHSVDKASGIVNDANDWGKEHDKPTYIVDLIKSVVTVSLRTLDLVGSLPGLGLKE